MFSFGKGVDVDRSVMVAQDGKASKNKQPPVELLRNLPAVERVLEHPEVVAWIEDVGCSRQFAARATGVFLEEIRAALVSGELDGKTMKTRLDNLAAGVASVAGKLTRPHLRHVINATGIVVHTNLGRSPWPAAVAARTASLGQRYLNLEFDLEDGGRGQRAQAVESLVNQLLPGTEVVVVNNNAAAVLLVLNTLAECKEVVVSRGQLVEIGGSFRIPEVMIKSHSILREVGTTNRTRSRDFEEAIGPQTGALLSVHPSNYRVVGFTEEAELEELVALGRDYDVPVVEDLGSGCLFDLRDVGIHDEPTVAQRLATGVDLVTFSGDKLLGGPQAGFIVGKPEYIAHVRSNPLYRALRLDKATTLALEGTLAIYVNGDLDGIPTIRMLRMPMADLESRAKAMANRLIKKECGALLEIVKVFSQVGGGGAPGKDLPSFGLSINPPDTAHALVARLRTADPPVIARIAGGRVILDVRTVLPDEDDALVGSIAKALID